MNRKKQKKTQKREYQVAKKSIIQPKIDCAANFIKFMTNKE